MIKLKYKSWNDITVDVFEKIKKINPNVYDDFDALNANVELISILCDVDEDVISNLSCGEFTKLLKETSWVQDTPKVDIKDKYVINGKQYKLFLELRNMSMSQYIDFQQLMQDSEKNFKQLLACFLIPEPYNKYGDGYDVMDVIKDVGSLPICDAKSIMVFFSLQYQSLTKAMLTYSIRKMKKARKAMKTQEEREKIDLAIEEMKMAVSLVESGDGFTL